ncbi:MAG TPA: hypothetical protein VFN87_21570 [Solirubrobacteraceae bacterium]|nr:hypothetical protein [Solirubrobacteraceae bacterium]
MTIAHRRASRPGNPFRTPAPAAPPTDPAPPGTVGSPMSANAEPPPTPARLAELEAQARYARQRYDLYKARTYSLRATSATRLRELERECARAEAALEFARQAAAHQADDPPA